jgi:UDP-N-acetylmuramoyl-L-alanyl-D-glutamate--2,6-diaminopimelate ligase
MEILVHTYEQATDSTRMTLSKLLEGVSVMKMFQTMYGKMVVTHDVQINAVQYDSRKITQGNLFVAIRGTASDGHTFITHAVNNGAKVVVMDDDKALPDSYFMHAGVVKIVVGDTRKALATISANYFDHPATKLQLIGVTGTNGKTTTTHLIKSILEAHGSTTGLIGTIEYVIGNNVIPATHTTPESLELQQLLANMEQQGCSSTVMEVSSHALHQHRVDEIPFRAGVFTNLTQDHLDYHGSMEEYFKAKQMLFEGLESTAVAVVNIDDEYGARMLDATSARKMKYGIASGSDVRGEKISLSMSGTRMAVVHEGETTDIASPLIGRFNVSNVLAAFATGIALGIPKQTIRHAIQSTTAVRGRFEQIASPAGWTAIVDYAHTPDALLKALTAVHEIFDGQRRGKIITVFGCGGNRDRLKRPKMAEIATAHSDVTIVTSDNPRQEKPETIIDEVIAGAKSGAEIVRETDRKLAIINALERASANDVVLIAGKGHEDYQIIKDEKIHFSDREVVEEFLRSRA